MFMHSKRLMYTARVAEQNPALASVMLARLGGPRCELAAATRYFRQALVEDDPTRRDMLRDIATEKLSHLEMIGAIICMLNKGLRGRRADDARDGELMAGIAKGGESHRLSLLHSGGALTESGRDAWPAVPVDAVGDPPAGLRADAVAAARTCAVRGRAAGMTDDPGIKDALIFLMARETAHRTAFERALHAIEPNALPGVWPSAHGFAEQHGAAQAPGRAEGRWNSGASYDAIADRRERAAE